MLRRKKKVCTFAVLLQDMVSIAQLVRASDCGSEGRGFDPHCSPKRDVDSFVGVF